MSQLQRKSWHLQQSWSTHFLNTYGTFLVDTSICTALRSILFMDSSQAPTFQRSHLSLLETTKYFYSSTQAELNTISHSSWYFFQIVRPLTLDCSRQCRARPGRSLWQMLTDTSVHTGAAFSLTVLESTRRQPISMCGHLRCSSNIGS